MATKSFFDGTVLRTVELPDLPLPDVLNTRGRDALDAVAPSAVNPTGVDPANLLVDAAALDNLVPTAGALSSTKFHDPLPGTGEGAGVGEKSGVTLRDAWINDPHKEPGTVDTVQTGEIGSALPPSVAAAAAVTNSRLETARGQGLPSVDPFEELANSFRNKGEIRAWIVDNGGEEPDEKATRDELLDEARLLHNRKTDEAVAALA